jgi:hypothetical protein
MNVHNAQNRIALARTTVTAAATEHLREQIVGGSVDPGETLPESRVGEMLGVSRAPIREALTLLEREGLVEFDRRGTARVCEFDLERRSGIGADAHGSGTCRQSTCRRTSTGGRSRRDREKPSCLEEGQPSGGRHPARPGFPPSDICRSRQQATRTRLGEPAVAVFAGDAAVSRVSGTTGADVHRSRPDDPGAHGVVPGHTLGIARRSRSSGSTAHHVLAVGIQPVQSVCSAIGGMIRMLQTYSLQQIQGGQQIEFIENDMAIPIFRRTQQPHRSPTSFLCPKVCGIRFPICWPP